MKKAFTKIAGSVAVVALAAVVAVPSASALTAADINLLVSLGVIPADKAAAALALVDVGNTTGSCGFTYTRNLTMGSTGADVVALQTYLETKGFLTIPVGVSKGYFGPLTRGALASFQASMGIAPPVGYFGPITMGRITADCVVTTPPTTGGGNTTTPTVLQGGAGSLLDIELTSSLNNEEVGEDQTDVEVAGLDFEADGSDLEITAVQIDFDKGTADKNFDRYATEVSIWLDGNVVARVDASDFDRGNNYGRTITLDRGAIVMEGDEGKLVVAISGVSNLDTLDLGETWSVDFESLRFRDATGAVITETLSTSDRTFSFEDFATAQNLEVKIRAGDSTINNARAIEVSSTTKTNDEEIFSFKVEAEGTSIYVDEIVVEATTTNATIDKVISAAYLYLDGNRVGTENIASTTSTITFDDLDLDLSKGTHNFVVRVDFKKADGTGGFVTGSTIETNIGSTERAAWYIEDSAGFVVTSGNRSGTETSDEHRLVTEGLDMIVTGSSVTSKNNDTTPGSSFGEFRMTVQMTAIGETLYVPQTSTRGASSTVGAAFQIEDSNGNAVTSAGTTTDSFTKKSGGTVSGNFIRIDEGQTATFELYVTYDPTTAGQYRTQLLTVGFNNSAATPNDTMSAVPAPDFETSNLQIQN
jgi:peptidoglycan hydrolase-like protein with peptidoglycan-binding domain